MRCDCHAFGRATNDFSRRGFLRSVLGLTSLVAASGGGVPAILLRAAAASERKPKPGDRVLVVVQLAGGNDGLNTVIPFGQDAYYRLRPSICVGPGSALKIADGIGLHPALDGFRKLHDAGRLAVVQGVGYPNPDRSHFRSTEIWETADPEGDPRFRRTGWLGRALGSLPPGADDALEIGSREPSLALAAEGRTVPSLVSLESLARGSGAADDPLRGALDAAFGRREEDAPDLAFLRDSGRRALEADRLLARALDEKKRPASGAEYPGFALAEKLRDVAAAIASGFPASIYYVSMSGFDTHARQTRQHELLLAELSQSLSAFVADLASRGHGERVLALTFSEFGRRAEENRSGGTDHGTAAPLFLASAAEELRGGLHGAHPSLDDLDQGDLRFHTDFRRVYATVLEGWLGIDAAPVLGKKFETLEVLSK